MFKGLQSLRNILYLGGVLAVLAVLACNPFAGGSEEVATENSGEVVQVNLDRPSGNPLNQPEGEPSSSDQQAESDQPATEGSGETAQQVSDEPTPEPSEIPQSEEPPAAAPPEESAEAPASSPSDASAGEVVELAWVFLTQCISLSTSDLQSRHVDGQWFVQAAGESPDLYGIWEVDPATGSVQPHNMRARQWISQFNSQCTEDDFAQFYAPTPAPPNSSGIANADEAATALWATLIPCYPTMQTGDLEATLNPTRAEWVVTGKPDVATNYGVWAVRSNGEVVPHNRQALGIYEQLGNGLC